jgi:SAM-dependent methyltransferase
MFDDFSDVYDAMIDWPKRLAHETSFYRRWFERTGVKKVIDTACGTGHHAAMFHDWGLRVEGADLSPIMIERARRRFGEPEGLRWVVRGYDSPIPFDGPADVDVVICVGNSLSMSPDLATAERAIVQMLKAVRSGGILIVQVQNLWSLPDGPCVWQKSKRAVLPQGETVILKGMHRCGSRGFVELAAVSLAENTPLRSETVPLLGMESADLERMAQNAGAAEIRFFGGYDDQPYRREKSTDLILVASK